MIKLMLASLILNALVFMTLIVWIIVMGFWHFKKDKKHEEEKETLKQSRDYHIKQLIERSEKENV